MLPERKTIHQMNLHTSYLFELTIIKIADTHIVDNRLKTQDRGAQMERSAAYLWVLSKQNCHQAPV